MADPSLNLINLVTIEDIYTSQQQLLSPINTVILNQLETEIFGLLTDINYNNLSPVGSFVVSNNIMDASNNLYDNPNITCVYTWTDMCDCDTQKILKLIYTSLKKMSLKVFFSNDFDAKRQTITIYYPSKSDKYILIR
jgi:hypothetical protein